jgi:hypothetical protein
VDLEIVYAMFCVNIVLRTDAEENAFRNEECRRGRLIMCYECDELEQSAGKGAPCMADDSLTCLQEASW